MRIADIETQPLAYVERLAMRPLDAIRRVVIHATELPDLALARTYGERVLYPDTGTGASGHYYIDRDGRTLCWVPPTRIAHHVRDHNADSVGIELVNLGRYPDWLGSRAQTPTEAFAEAQLAALEALLTALADAFPKLDAIAGHDELDTTLVPATDDPEVRVHRKIDPGPLFPWPRIRGAFAQAVAARRRVR